MFHQFKSVGRQVLLICSLVILAQFQLIAVSKTNTKFYSNSELALPCDTPVYRYAMYRWEPTDYELYFFYRTQDQLAGVAELKETLDKWSTSEEFNSNLSFTPVELTDDSAMTVLPSEICDCFSAQAKESGFVLAGSKRECMFIESLSVETLTKQFATRSVEICDKLADGNVCVFVVIANESSNSARKRAAEVQKQLEKLKRELDNETIRLSSETEKLEGTDGDSEGITGGTNQNRPSFDWHFLNDSDSPWLQWSLQHATEDGQQANVMVFPVFGRGRALPPIDAEKLTEKWLVDQLEFLTGACACTVKEQNPGVDLLMQYNWDSAAKTMVEKYGREEGNETISNENDYFPEFLLGGDSVPIVSQSTVAGNENAGSENSTNAHSESDSSELQSTKSQESAQDESEKKSDQSTDSKLIGKTGADENVGQNEAQKNQDQQARSDGKDSVSGDNIANGGSPVGTRAISPDQKTKPNSNNVLMMVIGAVAAVVFAVGGLLLIAKAK